MNLKRLYLTLITAGVDLDKIDLNNYPVLHELIDTLWDCVKDDNDYNTEVTLTFDVETVPELINEIITVVGLTQVRRDQVYKYEDQLNDMTIREQHYKSKIKYLETYIEKEKKYYDRLQNKA